MDRFRIDSHKLHLHPERVSQWKTAKTWEEAKTLYPLYWEITTSAACNHRCSFCSVDAIGYPAILMDAQILIERMREAQILGVKSVMFAGTGEPLLHKKIDHIVSGAVLSGLDVAFTTNGVLLNKLQTLDLCSWVKVSLNAGKAETYSEIHKTDIQDWYKVWQNIENANKKKKDCVLGVQCVVLPENVDEMPDLALRARDSGCNYLVLKPYSQGTFSLVQRVVDYKKMQGFLNLLPQEFNREGFEVIVRTNAINQEIEGKHHYDRCRATPNFWVYSMADGRVFTCSAHLMDNQFCIGNLNTQGFKEIWEGRKQNWELMKTFDIRECRLNCRMNGENQYLYDIEHAPHKNFI